MDKDVLNSLKGSFGLASKLVSHSVGEVSKRIAKGDESRRGSGSATNLYFKPQDQTPHFGLVPTLAFIEAQDDSRFNFNILKNFTMSGAEKAFVAGLHALIVGKVDEAKAKLREATRQGSDSKVQLTDAYFTLGCVMLSLEEPKEAITNFKTALLAQQSLGKTLVKYLPTFHASVPLTDHSGFCFFPDLLGLSVLLALALHLNGETEEAIQSLDQILGIMPGEAVAEFFINLLRMEVGQHREVFSSLQKTLPDSNIRVACMILLGRACVALGDPVTAREIFRKALQKDYLDPVLRLDLRHCLGEALAAEGWANDAVEEFQSVKSEKANYRAMNKRLSLAPEGPAPAPAPTAKTEIKAAPEPPPTPVKEPEQPEPAPTEEPGEAQPETAAAPAPVPESSGPLVLYCEERGIDQELTEEPLVIGREEGDLVLDGDSAASRLHARLFFDKGRYWIEDLGSTNGTWVNRHRIRRKVELQRGDLVQVGETSFYLR